MGDLYNIPDGRQVFYFKDPYGNILQAVESNRVFKKTKYDNGGVYGVVIGVSNMEKSIAFYRDVLGTMRLSMI